MPLIKRACRHLGCPEIVDRGFCEAHGAAGSSTQGREPRASRQARGYGASWQRRRTWYLKRHPVCECSDPACGVCAGGHTVPSTDVDHRVPRRRGGDDSDANLQALCHECHSSKTAREDGRWGGGGVG